MDLRCYSQLSEVKEWLVSRNFRGKKFCGALAEGYIRIVCNITTTMDGDNVGNDLLAFIKSHPYWQFICVLFYSEGDDKINSFIVPQQYQSRTWKTSSRQDAIDFMSMNVNSLIFKIPSLTKEESSHLSAHFSSSSSSSSSGSGTLSRFASMRLISKLKKKGSNVSLANMPEFGTLPLPLPFYLT